MDFEGWDNEEQQQPVRTQTVVMAETRAVVEPVHETVPVPVTDTDNVDDSNNRDQLAVVECIPTEEFAVGMRFPTLQDAMEVATKFAQFRLTMTSAKKKFYYFVCHLSRKNTSSVAPEDRKRKKFSKKCDCPFKICVVKDREDSDPVQVRWMNAIHNHETGGEDTASQRRKALMNVARNMINKCVGDSILYQNTFNMLSNWDSMLLLAGGGAATGTTRTEDGEVVAAPPLFSPNVARRIQSGTVRKKRKSSPSP